LGEVGGDRPAVTRTAGGSEPQVEGGRATVVDEVARRERTQRDGTATAVARLLVAYVLVVAERGRRGGLYRCRGHQAAVLADLAEVGDQLAVAGDEPGTEAGHVRALRQRVDRQHAVDPGGERGDRRG